MTPFYASRKEDLGKHCGKRRNCLNKQFLLFPQCFLLCQRQKSSFLLHLICRLQMLSIWSGNKILSCGNGLSPVLSVHHSGNRCPLTLGSALHCWHILSIQVRLSSLYAQQTMYVAIGSKL